MSRPSSYAARKPRNVITVPDAPNSAFSPDDDVPAMRSETVCPFASFICDAIVRIQISSYSAFSSRFNSRATSFGMRNVSPAGRIASCASCAFFTLRS